MSAINRKSSAKVAPKLSKKTRSEIQGSFGLKAKHGPNYSRNKGLGQPAAVCSECGAIYFEKHWHGPSAIWKKQFDLSAAKKVKCDACRTTAPGGVVMLENLKDAKAKAEVLAIVRNVGARAMRRDSQERILKILDRGSSLEVQVTENQLAVSIGKQVQSARKGGTLAIKFSKNDKPVSVRWVRGDK